MFILLIDLICIWLSLGMALGIRYGMTYSINNYEEQLWQIVLISVLYVSINIFGDLTKHFFRRGYFEELMSIVRSYVIFSVLWIVVLFLIHKSGELSRLVYGYFIVLNILLTFIGRILLKKFMIKIFKTSKYSNRLLLVSTAEQVETIIKDLIEYNEWSRILVGVVLTDKSIIGNAICGFPIVSDKSCLMNYVIHHNVDEIFINDPTIMSDPVLKQWVSDMEGMGVIVDVNIDIFNITSGGKKTLNRVGKYAVVTFARNIFSTRQMMAKRILDVIGSVVGIIILSIAIILVAPAIKLESPGPVFFGQTRIGKNGRKFAFYKFRSMYQNAEQRKKELMKKNEVKGLMFKLEDDPRITKVGRFIRKTSIDELPQFWNVLRGDMSLVGTRPPTVDEYERYEAKHKCRLSMTPGLTGLWQISGRSDIKDFDEVVKLDMQYIDDWTILKDIKILILTVWVVLTGKGSR